MAGLFPFTTGMHAQGFLRTDALLFVWDQIMFCLVGSSPTAQSMEYLLSAILAILIYLGWIRRPQENSQTRSSEQLSTTKKDAIKDAVILTKQTEYSESAVKLSEWPSRTTFVDVIRQIGNQLKIADIRFMVRLGFLICLHPNSVQEPFLQRILLFIIE